VSVANVKSETESPRLSLSPDKGRELKGVLFFSLGLLLAISLLSYQPADPSLLHQATGPALPTHNWAGTFGAQIAALGFALLGLTCLLVPGFLLVTGYRRFRGRKSLKSVSRGLGALILLVTLPGLLQLTLGGLSWRSGTIAAGGAFGELAAGFLQARLNLPGAFLVLLSAVIVASTLLVQSTLGEILTRWLTRLGDLWQRARLARTRSQEQRAREEARRRVEAKHVERALEEKKGRAGGANTAAALPPPELPLRIVERRGEPPFGIRKVSVPPGAAFEAPGWDGDFGEGSWEDGVAAVPAPVPAPAAAPRPAPPRPPMRSAAPRPPAPHPPAPQATLFPEVEVQGELPPVNLLSLDKPDHGVDENELVRLAEIIRQRCSEFGVQGSIEGISPGPVITVYEFQPAPGVKVSQIVNLQDDLALALKAESVRIDRLPGRSTLGIEVPNRKRQVIRLGPLLSQEAFERSPSVLTMALGVNIAGEPYYADLATMPHLLVAGATGAGKSVGLQAMITSILYKARRDQVQFIFIDPKRIELGVYADVPSLRTPVVVEPKQAANVLGHMVVEMENRYRKLAQVHVRSIAHYNQAIRDSDQRKRLALNEGEGELDEADFQPLPYYVIIIDELADLMMVSSSEVETAIARLAQMARAVGIHLIVATQRPSVDVLTGTIKANFPCRIAYATATRHDSRTILDQVGSEKLLGKGDMLFMPPGTSRVLRLHGAYVSEQETAGLIRWLKKRGKPDYDLDLLEDPEGKKGSNDAGGDTDDDLFDEAARIVVVEQMGSASFLQRRMRIGFARASRLIDMMAREGLLGPSQGSKPREVLVPPDYFTEIDATRMEE